jgi:methylmalonyl-CoA mutase N-terminal domain/subunit
VSISSLRDMARYSRASRWTRCPQHDDQRPGAILLALYIAVAKQQGDSPDKLRGTVQNDILKEYLVAGRTSFRRGRAWPDHGPVRFLQAVRAEVDTTISISGYHIREAGSTAVQEVAFTLADGIAYVEAAIAAGLEVDEFAPQLSFFFNAHNQFLEEVAKFRAARRLWAEIMRERFGAQQAESLRLKFHARRAAAR